MRHVWIGAMVLAAAVTGCTATHFPGQPTYGDLAHDLGLDEAPRTSRGQSGDDPIVVAQAPRPASELLPPPPGGAKKPDIPAPLDLPLRKSAELAPAPGSGIAPPPGGAQQVGLTSHRAARVLVRAWVNGRPIFDDEVMLQMEMSGALRGASPDKITEAYNQNLTNIIELEIAYQDAVHKLEKAAPKALEQLRELVDAEYAKQVKHIRKQLPDDKFQEIAPTFRRQMERQFIGMEYIRSRIFPILVINYNDIKDYYDSHLNEFQTLPSVKWQHIFIAANSQRQTPENAAAFAATLLEQMGRDPNASVRFAQLCKQHDDGDSKSRDGLGFGIRKGEIQPAELEAELFKMEPGQIGVLKVSTGAHIYRLESRVIGGQTPLNETIQAQIRNKIRNQVFEREFKRLVRELKTRAVVEIEKGG